jgi:hypothetical protein
MHRNKAWPKRVVDGGNEKESCAETRSKFELFAGVVNSLFKDDPRF